MDFVAQCRAAAGIIALEDQARDCLALSQVQRSNRRCALQARGLACARAAQAARAMMWRERYLVLQRELDQTLGLVNDLDVELAVVPRVRRLVYLRRVDYDLLTRILLRRPRLLGWAMEQRDEIRAELDAEENGAVL
jgi:hypothetical protein